MGGQRLHGSVRVTGAKNCVLKLMAAALLAQGTTTLTESSPTVPITTSCAGCGHPSACSVRYWPGAVRPTWRCPAATILAHEGWTCTSQVCGSWGPKSPMSTVT